VIHGGVAGDGEDPTPGGSAPLESVGSARDAYERFLDEVIEVRSVGSRETRKEPIDGLVMAIEELTQRIAITTAARLDQLLLRAVGPARLHVPESRRRNGRRLAVTVLGSIHPAILSVGSAIGSVGARIISIGSEIGAISFQGLPIALHRARVARGLVGGELRLLCGDGFAVRLAVGAIGLAIGSVGLPVGAVFPSVVRRGLSGGRRGGRLREGDRAAHGRCQRQDRDSKSCHGDLSDWEIDVTRAAGPPASPSWSIRKPRTFAEGITVVLLVARCV
jgi:hypothetical protein